MEKTWSLIALVFSSALAFWPQASLAQCAQAHYKNKNALPLDMTKVVFSNNPLDPYKIDMGGGSGYVAVYNSVESFVFNARNLEKHWTADHYVDISVGGVYKNYIEKQPNFDLCWVIVKPKHARKDKKSKINYWPGNNKAFLQHLIFTTSDSHMYQLAVDPKHPGEYMLASENTIHD
jgi:hypothetical protein